GVRGRNLPHARLVGVDAVVAHLHRVGRALERPGPSRHRRYEANGRVAKDDVPAKSVHGLTCLSPASGFPESGRSRGGRRADETPGAHGEAKWPATCSSASTPGAFTTRVNGVHSPSEQ